MSEPLVSASSVATRQALESTTPQERLANSRKALVWHMTRHQPPSQRSSQRESKEQQEASENFSESRFDPQNADADQVGKRRNSGSGFGMVWQILVAWWSRHPANIAIDIARPVLTQYAEKKPFRVLGVAAAAGAVLVLIKPWRIVTPGAILLGVLKSSGLTNSLLSLLSGLGRK